MITWTRARVKMFDRTEEFSKLTRARSPYLNGNSVGFVFVSITTETATAAVEETDNGFLSQIEIVTKIISEIKVITRRLDALHRAALSEATNEKYEKARKEIDELCKMVTSEASRGKTVLKQQSTEIKASPSNSWKRAKFGSTCSEFLETVRLYEIQQEAYSEKYRRQYERQILLMNPSATANEIEAFSGNSPNMGRMLQVFQMEMQDREREQARLDDMKGRYEEMQLIEKNALEIQEIFKEISLLVQCQGDSINRIEEHLGETKEYLDSSLKALEKRIKIEKKRQKRRLAVFTISFTILIILLAIVFHEAYYLFF